MRTTPILAALLMLGGVSYASAQEGPSEGPRGASGSGPSAAQEGGSGSDAGVSNRSGGGDEGPSAKGNENGSGSKGRSAESSEKSNEKSASERSTGDAKKSAADKSSVKSTAESRSDGSNKQMSRDDAKKSGSPSPDTTDRSATETTKGTSTERSAESKPSGDKARQIDLSGDKRMKVTTAFRDVGSNVKRRTNVDIDISVGRRLPRDWDFVPVPVAVIEIVPEYRSYYFAYVGDEYIIVEPDTYEVVAVLPAERNQAGTSGSGQCSAQLSLSSQERELVLDNVKGGRPADVSDISVGRAVPDGIELLRFSDSVISQAKELQGCQYFDAGDQIAIVDPDEDKIVAIIDKS